MGTVTTISTGTSKDTATSSESGHRKLRVGALGSTFAAAILVATGGPAAAMGRAGTKGLAKAPIAVAPAPATGISFSQLTHMDMMLLACVAVVVVGALALVAYHRRSASVGAKHGNRKLANTGITELGSRYQTGGPIGFEAYGSGTTEADAETADAGTAGIASLGLWSPPRPADPPPTAPGWYPMTQDPTLQNYWDGISWTTKIRWDGSAWQQVA